MTLAMKLTITLRCEVTVCGASHHPQTIRSIMQSFNITVGERHKFGCDPKGDQNEAEGVSGNASYTSSDPALATVDPNPAVANLLECVVTGKATGNVVITISAPDSEPTPVSFSSQFEIVIGPANIPHATHFDVRDMGAI